MKHEILLLKCDNTIYADEITSLLADNGIASRQNEEGIDTAKRQIGISIFVYDDDYERASVLIAPILEARNKVCPMCPKCGSEDVKYIPIGVKYANAISILVIFCFLIPGIYIGLPRELMVRNDILNIIALVMAISGVIMVVVLSRKGKNYECRNCGKKFYHI